MRLKLFFLFAFTITLFQGLTVAQSFCTVFVEEGEIEGALFKMIVPVNRSGNVLVIAHGYVPPEEDLVVELIPEAPFMRQLASDGWIVAKTSYRRNGLVIEEGLEDLDSLVALISERYGKPKLVILEGSSMGGSIAVKAAERAVAQPDRNVYDGIIALGAAMDIRIGDLQLVWTYLPGLPVLFLSNKNELAGPATYCRSVSRKGVGPALWYLERDGHVNLNFAERMAALVVMEDWIVNDHRPQGTAPRGWDATVAMGRQLSTARKQFGGLAGRVVHVDQTYGNIQTSFVENDLDALGLKRGEPVFISCGGNTVMALWETRFSDVPEGKYVVFINASGYLRLAINMGNAAQKLGLVEGDGLIIKSLAH